MKTKYETPEWDPRLLWDDLDDIITMSDCGDGNIDDLGETDLD